MKLLDASDLVARFLHDALRSVPNQVLQQRQGFEDDPPVARWLLQCREHVLHDEAEVLVVADGRQSGRKKREHDIRPAPSRRHHRDTNKGSLPCRGRNLVESRAARAPLLVGHGVIEEVLGTTVVMVARVREYDES